MGKLRQSPCPTEARPDTWQEVRSPICGGETEAVDQVPAGRAEPGRQGHVLTHKDRDLVRSARWGRGERPPVVKETHGARRDWRGASAGSSFLVGRFLRPKGPISQVPGSVRPPLSPRRRHHGSASSLPRHSSGHPQSARLRTLGFGARANGRPRLPSGKCSPQPGALGDAMFA